MYKVCLVILFATLFMFSSCRDEITNPNKELTVDDFKPLTDKDYKLNSRKVRREINRLIARDSVFFTMDKRTVRYYSDKKPFIWVSRLGVRGNADTLLTYLGKVREIGLNPEIFRVNQIEKDIHAFRNLEFNGDDDINLVLGRIEYLLTKAYFRYTAGQRFGFINPDYVYNRMDVKDSNSVRVTYHQVSDLKPQRPDDNFFDTAVTRAGGDSLSAFLSSVSPQGTLYEQLISLLKDPNNTSVSRQQIICNIERCRWRLKNSLRFDEYKKYVIVNIPSFSLRAVCPDSVLTMRTGCGSVDHKTPLLVSAIKRMDVNPQWIVPQSIAKGIVGRNGYMRQMGMFVYDKKRGKLPPGAASYSKIMSGEQHIIQAGGKNNSLGRVIFRFDNNFSVYLHDTSAPWVFQKQQRDISHGCVRVEKPLELAMFLADKEDESTKEKLRYSMTYEFADDNDPQSQPHIDKSLIINSLNVTPQVPVFLTYYTVFYNAEGKLQSYPDVYGYDRILLDNLSSYAR